MSNWRTTPGGHDSDVEAGLRGLFFFVGIFLLIAYFILKWLFGGIKKMFKDGV